MSVGATLALLLALRSTCRNLVGPLGQKFAGVVGHSGEVNAELGWQTLDPHLQRQDALFTHTEQT